MPGATPGAEPAHSSTSMFLAAHISFSTSGHTVTLTSPR